MSSNYRTPDRASASALSQSRKLLDGYDEEPLAKALFARIASGHYEPNPINKNPRYISIFSVFAEHGNRPDYGAYHAQLAFVKALKWLERRGIIEIVSLAKTRLRRGIVVCNTGAFFRFELSPKVESRVSRLLHPNRWIKCGDPVRQA